MIIIYQFKKNKIQISSIQNAILTNVDFGLQQTHGLFGSDEWWQQIANGRLPLHTNRGKITRVYMTGMGDCSEFEMANTDGTKEAFTSE